MDADKNIDWKSRMIEIKNEHGQGRSTAPPPEREGLKRQPNVLAPGFVPFMYRLGLVPRHPEILLSWKSRMRSISDLQKSDDIVHQFKLIRDSYLAAFPRHINIAEPSYPANRLVSVLPRPGGLSGGIQ